MDNKFLAELVFFFSLIISGFSHIYSQQQEYHFYSNQLPVVKTQKVTTSVDYTTKTTKDKFIIHIYFSFHPVHTQVNNSKIRFQLQTFNINDSIISDREVELYLIRTPKKGYEGILALDLPNENASFIRLNNLEAAAYGTILVNIPYNQKLIKEKPLDIIKHTESSKITNHRITTKDTFHIVHQNGEVFLHYFGLNSFPPASIFNKKNNLFIPKSLKVYQIKTQKPNVLTEPGLYLFSPNDSLNGISNWLFCTNETFPKLKTSQQLLEPLYYILTTAEYEKTINHKNKKAVIDSIWLGIAGNMEYAKKLISTYYSRVQFANENYTLYKEGWKTDMGMIYTVFGAPDEIFNDQIEQQWVYKDRKQELIFIFTLKKTPLGVYEYVLNKNKEYEKEWNNTVEKWRKGIVE